MRNAVIGALLLLLLPTLALADWPSAVVLETGYVGGPANWVPWANFPAMGDPLWVVGQVREFHAPFEGVAPSCGSCEVTYAYFGSVCTNFGIWEDFQSSAGLFATFEGGDLCIYLDETPDADFTDPATFRDGRLLLEAHVDNLLLQIGYLPPWEPPVREFGMNAVFVGGEWFDLVSDDGEGYAAENYGDFNGNIPESVRQLGYIGQAATSVTIRAPVATKTTTWGNIKALYR